jgi:hypothetical protein
MRLMIKMMLKTGLKRVLNMRESTLGFANYMTYIANLSRGVRCGVFRGGYFAELDDDRQDREITVFLTAPVRVLIS